MLSLLSTSYPGSRPEKGRYIGVAGPKKESYSCSGPEKRRHVRVAGPKRDVISV